MANGTVRLLRRSVRRLDVAGRPHGQADLASVGVERTTRRDEPVMIVPAAVDAGPRATPGDPLGRVRPVLPPHTREVTGSIPVLPMPESPLAERVFAFLGGSPRLRGGASTCRGSSSRGCARTEARTGAATRRWRRTAPASARTSQDQPKAEQEAARPVSPSPGRSPAPPPLQGGGRGFEPPILSSRSRRAM